jgi:tetratricopeptide (TPR) repeat protein
MTDEKEQPEPVKLDSRFYRVDKPVPAEVYDFLRRYEIDKGIEYLDKLLEKDPKFEDAWTTKGSFYRVADRYEEAIAAYDKALEINPQSQKAKAVKQMAVDGLNNKKRKKGTH